METNVSVPGIEEILRDAPDGFVAYDSGFRAVLVNRAAERLSRRAKGELTGCAPWELFSGDQCEDAFRRIGRERVPERFEYFSLELELWLEVHAGPAERGGISAWYRDITARKVVEASLRENEERYRSMVTAMAEGVIFHDREGRIGGCNAAAERILGLTAAQIVGSTSALNVLRRAVREDGSPFPPEEAPSRTTLGTGRPVSDAVIGIHRPDGTLRWISVNTEPLFRNDETAPYAVVTTLTDITERKTAEDRLRQAQADLAAVLESTDDLIWSVDVAGKLLYFNRAMANHSVKMGGRVYAGAEPGTYVPTSKVHEVIDYYARTLAEGPLRGEHVLSDGRILELALNRIIHDGRVAGVSVFGKDVTERRRAEQALIESERRLSLALDAVSDGVFDWQMRSGASYFSPRYYTMLGYQPYEFPPSIEAFGELLHPDDRPVLEGVIAEYFARQRESHSVECRLRTKSGEWRWILTRGRIVRRDADGNPLQMLGTHFDITERKHSEQALMEAHDRLNSYLEHSPLAAIEWDAQMRVTRWTRRAERTFGWSAAEVLGRRFDEFRLVFDEDASQVLQDLTDALEDTRSSYVSKNRNAHKDGTVLHCEWFNTIIRDTSGRMASILSQVWDVTERKRLEEEVRRLQLSAEYSRDIIFYIGDGLRIQEANPSAMKAYGYSREELLSMSVPDLRVAPLPIEELEDFHTRGLLFESLHKRKDGSTFPVEVSAQSAMIAGQRFMIAVVRDITERKRAEEALQRSEERFRRLVELEPDAILLHDGERVTFANPAAVALFRARDVKDLLGRHPLDLVHPDSKEVVRARLETLRAEGGFYPLILERLMRFDGSSIDAEVISTSFVYLGQRIAEVVIRDISERTKAERERRALEEQLQQAQKLESIGTLAGGVAHDFNNLLTVINGYSDILLSRLKPDDPGREWAEEIAKAGERAASLTRQMLAFSRKQVVQPRPVNLNDVIAENSGMLQRLLGEDVEIETDLEPEVGSIMADAGQLNQVLMNLAANARHAMPSGGHLSFTTRNVDADEACAAAHPGTEAGPFVLLTVSDTGTGIPKEIQGRIFDPFFTTKPVGEGTGLGLSTVYGIVKQSGGAIFVRSEPGFGAAFDIWLPRIEAPCRAPSRLPVEAGTPDVCGTVLVVEDQEPVRRLVVQTLERSGYRVLEASAGREAIETAEGWPERIDLIVVDMVMPGMTGVECAARLAGLHPDASILYMSGYTGDGADARKLCETGAHFLAKPFGPDLLIAKVREVLGAGSRAADNGSGPRRNAY